MQLGAPQWHGLPKAVTVVASRIQVFWVSFGVFFGKVMFRTQTVKRISGSHSCVTIIIHCKMQKHRFGHSPKLLMRNTTNTHEHLPLNCSKSKTCTKVTVPVLLLKKYENFTWCVSFFLVCTLHCVNIVNAVLLY